jgi:integrase
MSFTLLTPGIYKDSRTGNFFERPRVNGRRTWRKLHSRTLKLAREELAAKRSDHARSKLGLAKNPYDAKPHSIGGLCIQYLEAGCPNRQQQERTGKQLAQEQFRLNALIPFWKNIFPTEVKYSHYSQYFNWRKKQTKKARFGGRAVDMELNTLSNALSWALSVGKIEINPCAGGRPRFRPGNTVRHCREFAPLDGNELHALAGHFFEDRRSEVLGWQLLIEAMTGCRTSEVLKLRLDARHKGEPGFIDHLPDSGKVMVQDGNHGWLWIARSKGGVKPFVQIHPALAECLESFNRWHLWRFPKSKWWFPSSRKGEHLPIDLGSLTQALKMAGKLIAGAHRTSHGLRAYYVTVRRSQGIPDAQIADEIGDRTGAAMIVSTYGSVPPNWRGSEAIQWLPTKGKPAWTVLKMPENVVALDSGVKVAG